jgi:LPS sulfotransferase NodH
LIVCTLPRSGSWLFCDGLERTGVAGRPQEYFRPDWRQRFEQVGALAAQSRLHQRDPWPATIPGPRVPPGARDIHHFLSAVRRVGTTDNGVFAVKCHWFQARDVLDRVRAAGRHGARPRLHDLFPGSRYLRLIRTDKTRQAISWHRAITGNQWYATGEAGAAPARFDPARFDPGRFDPGRIEALRRRLERLERRWTDYFAEIGVEPAIIRYEELAADYPATIRRCLADLGLWSPGVVVAAPRLTRQADRTTERWVGALAPATARHRRPVQEKTMRTDVIIVDNFYANPEAVREYALKQDYCFPYQTEAEVAEGRKVTWMSTRFRPAADCPFKSSAQLVEQLEQLTGDRIDIEHWNRDFPVTDGKPRADHRSVSRSCLWNCAFHLKPATGQRLGQGVHNHVVDTWNGVGENGWSGLIYLNDDAPLRGGLKLWRNVDPAHNYDWMTPKENWELIDDLGNVANRLLLCRGSIPHSGAGGWGSTLTDGRLYQTFFFRVRPRLRPPSFLAPV